MEYIEELKKRYSSFDAIQSLVDNDVPEDLYMDYKSIGTKDDAQRFDAKDAELLGTALSGFANVEGGILIWGVREEKPKGSSSKVPRFQQGILKTSQAAQKFKKFLEENTGRCAVPPPRGVVHLIVDNGEKDAKYQAVVLTCIPKGNSTPLQSLKDQKFYLRSGESFMPAPYSVIAGMFGKRQMPEIEVKIQFGPWNENAPITMCSDSIWQPFGLDTRYFRGYIALKNIGLNKLRDPYFSLNLSTVGNSAYLQYASLLPKRDGEILSADTLAWFPYNRKSENWRINPKMTICNDVHIVAENPFESVVSGEYLVIPFGLKIVGVPSQWKDENITLTLLVGGEDLIQQKYDVHFEMEFLRDFEKNRLKIIEIDYELKRYKMYQNYLTEENIQILNDSLRSLYSKQFKLISSKNMP